MNGPISPGRRVSNEFQLSMHRTSAENTGSERGILFSSESVIKSSRGQKIEKLCGQSEWQQRFICVTAENFFILHSEFDDDSADHIPLVRFIVISPLKKSDLEISESA